MIDPIAVIYSLRSHDEKSLINFPTGY